MSNQFADYIVVCGDELGRSPILGPCDHCGGTAHYVRAKEGYKAICEGCGLQTAPYPWAENAGEAWNRRITTHARVITLNEIIEYRGRNTDDAGKIAVWVETIEGELRAGVIKLSVSMDGLEVFEPAAAEYWPRDLINAEGIRWRLWTMRPTETDRKTAPWGQVAWRVISEEARAEAEKIYQRLDEERRRKEREISERWRRHCIYCARGQFPVDENGVKAMKTHCLKDGHPIDNPSDERCDEWTDEREGAAP